MTRRIASLAERGVELLGRGASLVVTDRRWGATLSAAALGFGLFVGVAIGPGATGTFATGQPQLLALSGPSGSGETTESAPAADSTGSAGNAAEAGIVRARGGESSSLESLPVIPLVGGSSEPLPPIEEEEAPESAPPPAREEREDVLETTALAGVVVHHNPRAGSYTLVIEGGELVPVHATELPRVGTKLSLGGLQLANGTFAEEGAPERKKGQPAATASFRGAVTFVDADPLAPGYTVSGRGSSLFVAVAPDPSGALPALPSRGAYVTATVALETDGRLLQRKLEIEPGEPATYLDLSGVYAGLHPETGQLQLSADDTRASEEDLLLSVPAGIDASRLKPGDSYLATATVEPDGTLTLAGIASDERRKGAEDDDSAQGDLKR